MNERLKNVQKRAVDFWNKYNRKQKTMMISITLAVIILLIVMVVMFTKPSYVTLVECDSATTASDVKDSLKDKDSLFNHYKEVIRIRNAYPVISQSQFTALDLGDNALFAAQYEDFIIVHNFADKDIVIDGAYDIIEDGLGGKLKDGKVHLGPYESVIIKQK